MPSTIEGDERMGTVPRARRVLSIGVALLLSVGLFGNETVPAHATSMTGLELTVAVRHQLENERGNYRVSVRELGGLNRTVDIDSTHTMEPASSIKLFYAWLALRRVDNGRWSLSTKLSSGVSVGKCLRVMIQVSDNLCSADLREGMGNRWVNRALDSAGFDGTRILVNSDGGYRSKRSSPADLTDLLARLEAGELLSADATNLFHQLLRDQVWRSRIAGGVPGGVVVESKPGELVVNSRWVQTDAAIVRGPNSTYVISIMGDSNATKRALRNVSQIVYEGLQGEDVLALATYPGAQFTALARAEFRPNYGGAVTGTIPFGRAVTLKFTSRLDAFVEVRGMGTGWVKFTRLRLRDEFRWLG